MSEAKEISIAMSERIGEITQANGYLTNIGAKVFRGRRKIDEQTPPCCVIVEGDEVVGGQNKSEAKLDQQYFIEGHAPCDADNPNDMAHDIIADLKRAIFRDTRLTAAVRTIEYKSRTINPREDGVALIAASIEIMVQFVEKKAAP